MQTSWPTTLLILALTGFSIYKTTQIRALQSDNADKIVQLEQLKLERQAAIDAQQPLRHQITLVKDNDTRRIALTDGSDKVNTYVYYNPIRQETALDLSGVPNPPKGQYLQAWTREKGQPVSLGMVATSAVGSWQVLPYRPDAEEFSISQEMSATGTERPTIVLMISK